MTWLARRAILVWLLEYYALALRKVFRSCFKEVVACWCTLLCFARGTLSGSSSFFVREVITTEGESG